MEWSFTTCRNVDVRVYEGTLPKPGWYWEPTNQRGKVLVEEDAASRYHVDRKLLHESALWVRVALMNRGPFPTRSDAILAAEGLLCCDLLGPRSYVSAQIYEIPHDR